MECLCKSKYQLFTNLLIQFFCDTTKINKLVQYNPIQYQNLFLKDLLCHCNVKWLQYMCVMAWENNKSTLNYDYQQLREQVLLINVMAVLI